MKNKTTSAERLFQDVRTSSEEMTSSDVKKVTKMDQKISQNGPKCVHKSYLRNPELMPMDPPGPSGMPGGPEVQIYK